MIALAEQQKPIQPTIKAVKGVSAGLAHTIPNQSSPDKNFVFSYKRFFLGLLIIFTLLGHNNNGRTRNLYGPDRSGTYGGAQGIGGLEATWQLSGNVINGTLNNYFGESLGTINSSGTFTSYNGVLGSYGPMPNSLLKQDLTPQWCGHYLDGTGFYYMGARYYEPNSGRFLSPDPLGHDASLSLYDYCGGDPVNGLDADGRDAMSLGDGSGNYYYITRKDFNASNVIGSVITHPNPNCSGQCMTGAQFLTGTVVKGAIYDAPRSATFTQGDTVNRNTPMNSMVATGWINGKYPSAPISAYQPGGRLDGQDINHVGIFMGMNPGGKSFKLLNQWTGQPMHVDPEDSDKYSLVLGTEKYDDRAPSVAIPVKATGGCGR